MNFKKIFYALLALALVGGVTYFSIFAYNNGFIKVKRLGIQTAFQELDPHDLRVFVINLDRTPERYSKVKAQLDKEGVPHERFSAVDGYTLEIRDLESGHVFSGQDLKEGKAEFETEKSYEVLFHSGPAHYTPEEVIYHDKKYVGLSAGELGCWGSHRDIWQKMIDENIPYALILEDDVILEPNFKNNLDALLKDMPKPWDLLFTFMEIDPKKSVSTMINNPMLAHLNSDQRGFTLAAGYLVSQTGAQKLMNLSQSFQEPVDCFISRRQSNGKLIIYKTTLDFLSARVGEDPTDSTIFQMGRPHF